MSMAKVCLLEIRLDKLVRNVTIHFDSKSFFLYWEDDMNSLLQKALGHSP